jgi:hypothetical protein
LTSGASTSATPRSMARIAASSRARWPLTTDAPAAPCNPRTAMPRGRTGTTSSLSMSVSPGQDRRAGRLAQPELRRRSAGRRLSFARPKNRSRQARLGVVTRRLPSVRSGVAGTASLLRRTTRRSGDARPLAIAAGAQRGRLAGARARTRGLPDLSLDPPFRRGIEEITVGCEANGLESSTAAGGQRPPPRQRIASRGREPLRAPRQRAAGLLARALLGLGQQPRDAGLEDLVRLSPWVEDAQSALRRVHSGAAQ